MLDMFSALKYRLGLFFLRKYKTQLSEKPLDSGIHLSFSKTASKFGLNDLANAELRTAEYLGADHNEIILLCNKIKGSLSNLHCLDTNQYQRFSILQSHLNKLLKRGESILDIGGGHGILSQFMPDNRYFLVEPSVNGISGVKLPFADDSVDAVVACHVLEHIAANERSMFINEIVRVAKKNVLILNPFKNKELNEIERLQLVLDVTKATWAEEHMECGLPSINEITDYLSARRATFYNKRIWRYLRNSCNPFYVMFCWKN